MNEALELQQLLQEKWDTLWWALATSLFAIAIAWRYGLFTPFQSSSIPVIGKKDVFKGFGFYLCGALLITPFIFSVVSILSDWKVPDFVHLSTFQKGVFNLCAIIGGFIGVVLAYFQIDAGQRMQLWKQTDAPWYYHFGIGIVSWFVIFPIVVVIDLIISIVLSYLFAQPVIEQIAVQNFRNIADFPWLFGLTGLTVITIVPWTEEVLFRGLLQNWFKQIFQSTAIGIFFSSLVFAFFHFSFLHGWTNIELLSSLFILSCMLGFIYERQRSLWASMGLHAFFNLVSLVFIFKE